MTQSTIPEGQSAESGEQSIELQGNINQVAGVTPAPAQKKDISRFCPECDKQDPATITIEGLTTRVCLSCFFVYDHDGIQKQLTQDVYDQLPPWLQAAISAQGQPAE